MPGVSARKRRASAKPSVARKRGETRTRKVARKAVSSLLDAMVDGREFASLIDVRPQNLNFRDELRRVVADVEEIRQRPLLIYAANVIKPIRDVPVSLNVSDDLPFSEMVAAVPNDTAAIDILVVTPGGLAQQVSQFVDRTRPRFESVGFIVPHLAMSAGTIWVLSGDEVWMDRKAYIGPIDPQVPGKDGRLLPAQALTVLVQDIREKGEKRLSQGQNPEWTDVQILRGIDQKELGNVLTASRYSIQLASEYLENYKFKHWTSHSDGRPVTPAERRKRAIDAATKLCSHEVWKTHSHGISRDIAWHELRIKIGHPENVDGFERAIRRLWALLYWVFENSSIAKVFVSQDYSLFRAQPGG